jgi:hypothetical protein
MSIRHDKNGADDKKIAQWRYFFHVITSVSQIRAFKLSNICQ